MLSRHLKLRRGTATCALLALLFTGQAGAGETTRIGLLFELIESIGPQIANQLEIAGADLGTISRRDGWTAEQTQSGAFWLEGLRIFKPDQPAVDPRSPEGLSTVLTNAGKPLTLLPPVATWAGPVAARLQALERFSMPAYYELLYRVDQWAENAWLEARQPADLEPARQVVARFKAQLISSSFPGGGPRYFFPNPTVNSRTGNSISMSERLFSTEPFLSGSAPLLLPEPENDPAEYARCRRRWADLQNAPLFFGKRPAVKERVQEYDRRFVRAARQVTRALDDLILRQAPADTLIQAAARLENFRTPAFTPDPEPAPSGASPFHPRDRFRQLSASSREPLELMPLQTLDAYQHSVALLTAPPATAPAERTWLQEKLRPNLPALNHLVRSFLETALAPADPNAPAWPVVPAGTAPDLALRTLLENIARQTENPASAAARSLLADWRGWTAAAVSPSEINAPAAGNAWLQLAALPGSAVLFAAREQAVRQGLAKICGPVAADAPPVLLREQWEKAVSAQDWPRARRLLALELAAGVLREEESQSWRQALANFQTAEENRKVGSPGTARQLYRTILGQTTSRAAAETAARLLRALPPAPAAALR